MLEHAAQGRGKRCHLRLVYAAARMRDSLCYPRSSPPTARALARGIRERLPEGGAKGGERVAGALRAGWLA